MNLESLLASHPWMLAVDRGFRSLPLSDTVYYKYVFSFSASDSLRCPGFLTVEATSGNGKAIRIRDGLQQRKVINPFLLAYSGPDRKHAILKCTRLHARETKDGKVEHEYLMKPPIVFNCDRRGKEGIRWEISGSMYDTRAFFTPNQGFNDHFGYLSVLLSKAMIRVSPREMSFHLLTSGLHEVIVCKTVDLKMDEEDSDYDLEGQMVLPSSSSTSSASAPSSFLVE